MPTVELPPPAVSVIMCTRNRPSMIRQAVTSVLANDHPAFDLTIIDQSTTNATEDILRPLVEADSRLHFIRVPEPGLTRAYNTAIRQTTGELLAFTDDDCVSPSGWLRAVVGAFDENEDADLLYGQVLSPPGANAQAGITPTLAIRRPERLSRRDGFRICGMGANFAARRRLFRTIGGFDEMLGPGAPFRSANDSDLNYRTYLAGKVILLRPEVQIIHYGTRTPQDWPATLRDYGIGDGAFYFKYVRGRDPFALWLLARQLVNQTGRHLLHRLRRRGSTDMTYERYVLVGMLKCLRFGIDRRSQLYIPR